MVGKDGKRTFHTPHMTATMFLMIGIITTSALFVFTSVLNH